MLKMQIVVLVLIFLCGSSHQKDTLGIINPPPNNCGTGEAASFINMDAFDCVIQPCAWIRGYTYEIGISFTPSVSTTTIEFGGKFKYGSSNPDIETLKFPGTYLAGHNYRLSRSITLPQTLDLGHSTFEVWLYDSKSRLINRCLDYKVVEW